MQYHLSDLKAIDTTRDGTELLRISSDKRATMGDSGKAEKSIGILKHFFRQYFVFMPLLAMSLISAERAFADDMILSCKTRTSGLYSSIKTGNNLELELPPFDLTVIDFDNIQSISQIRGDINLDYIMFNNICDDTAFHTIVDDEKIQIMLNGLKCKGFGGYSLNISRLTGDFRIIVFRQDDRLEIAEGECLKVQKKF